jgi:Protein of unknown function (DUF3303)
MRYLVIERFIHGPAPVYARAAERGRMMPDGLLFVDSWIVDDARLDTCYQVMETDDRSLLDEWIANWSDLTAFEVVPVLSSAEASARMHQPPIG